MQVMAFSTPARPDWRWRIVSNDGELIEESRQTFTSIAAAVSDGTDRVRELDSHDPSQRIHPFRMGAGYTRSR